jgi:CubicO group peptidase (beta-lactamase class C family)
VRTIADVIKLNGSRSPAFEPGSKEEYSNYGFILLGALIEKATGRSYFDYVNEHVFRLAGMNATKFPVRDDLAGVAVPYTTVMGELVPSSHQLPWRGMSAGGGVSTAEDELRFVRALREGKLISASMLHEATKQQTPWYGYGFISSPPDDYPHWGHGGGAPGMSVVLAVYPTNGVTIVCMSNRDPPVCDRLALNIHFHLAPLSAR